MVIGIIGESRTGKSTITDKLKSLLGAEVYKGYGNIICEGKETETLYLKHFRSRN